MKTKDSKDKVLVLKDDEGNVYTITPELLQLGKVNSKNHISLVNKILDKQGRSKPSIEKTFPSFTVEGVFDRSEDPEIVHDYFQSKIEKSSFSYDWANP